MCSVLYFLSVLILEFSRHFLVKVPEIKFHEILAIDQLIAQFIYIYIYILLTVHLNIFILILTNLMH